MQNSVLSIAFFSFYFALKFAIIVAAKTLYLREIQ